MQKDRYLFRGFIKYPSDIINGFWYGDLIHYANGDIYIRQVETGMENEVIPESVGQFTGVVDKNGVNIYEGDFLEGFKYPVTFEDGCFCATIQYDLVRCWLNSENCNLENLEVIGNSHDNAEMLVSF